MRISDWSSDVCSSDLVNIGHRAIVHGCTLQDRVLIGMGAIVMDKAFVSEYCLIAAGAVELENTVCEAGHIYAGTQERKIKTISAEQSKIIHELPARNELSAYWLVL